MTWELVKPANNQIEDGTRIEQEIAKILQLSKDCGILAYKELTGLLSEEEIKKLRNFSVANPYISSHVVWIGASNFTPHVPVVDVESYLAVLAEFIQEAKIKAKTAKPITSEDILFAQKNNAYYTSEVDGKRYLPVGVQDFAFHIYGGFRENHEADIEKATAVILGFQGIAKKKGDQANLALVQKTLDDIKGDVVVATTTPENPSAEEKKAIFLFEKYKESIINFLNYFEAHNLNNFPQGTKENVTNPWRERVSSADNIKNTDPNSAFNAIKNLYLDIDAFIAMQDPNGYLHIGNIDEKTLLEDAGLIPVFRIKRRGPSQTVIDAEIQEIQKKNFLEEEEKKRAEEERLRNIPYKTWEEYQQALNDTTANIYRLSFPHIDVAHFPNYERAYRLSREAAPDWVGRYTREEIEAHANKKEKIAFDLDARQTATGLEGIRQAIEVEKIEEYYRDSWSYLKIFFRNYIYKYLIDNSRIHAPVFGLIGREKLKKLHQKFLQLLEGYGEDYDKVSDTQREEFHREIGSVVAQLKTLISNSTYLYLTEKERNTVADTKQGKKCLEFFGMN